MASHAAGLGLGGHDLQSYLGQPLRMIVNVIGDEGDGLGCYRVGGARNSGDGVPQVTQADVRIDPTPGHVRLFITGRSAINDPIVRISVEAGCQSVIARDYVLLLDPASFVNDAPAVAEAPRAEPVPAPPPVLAQTGKRVRAPSAATSPGNRTAVAAAPRPRAARAPVPEAGPRLEVSRTQTLAATPASPAQTAPKTSLRTEEDATRAVEEEVVVLQKRIAYLKESLARLQALEASRTAPGPAGLQTDKAVIVPPVPAANAPALQSAGPPATTAPAVNDSSAEAKSALGTAVGGVLAGRKAEAPAETAPAWSNPGWFFWGLLLLTLALAAALYYRLRRPSYSSVLMPVRGTRYGPAANTRTGATPAPPPTPLDSIDGGGTQPWPRKEHELTVTELSATEPEHVTEQANVFARLGHHEQAVAVLREYVERQGGVSPAPLLMLLDLYREDDHRSEYEDLAHRLKAQFNVRTPNWAEARSDAANDATADPGLEAFPHIIAKLVELWGTQACQDYMQSLLMDSRGGTRVGFSLAAYFEILFLMRVQDDLLRHGDRSHVDWGVHLGAHRAAGG